MEKNGRLSILISLFLLVLTICATPARATIVTWEARGLVEVVDGSVGFLDQFPDPAPGDEFVMQVSFDTSTLPFQTSEGAQGTRYRYLALLEERTRVFVGGTELILPSPPIPGYVEVWDGFNLGIVDPFMGPCFYVGGAPCDGIRFAHFDAFLNPLQRAVTFGLRGPEHLDIIDGSSLPTTPDQRSPSLTFATWYVGDLNGNFSGDVSSVRLITVPAPMSLSLLVLAMLGLVVHQRTGSQQLEHLS